MASNISSSFLFPKILISTAFVQGEIHSSLVVHAAQAHFFMEYSLSIIVLPVHNFKLTCTSSVEFKPNADFSGF